MFGATVRVLATPSRAEKADRLWESGTQNARLARGEEGGALLAVAVEHDEEACWSVRGGAEVDDRALDEPPLLGPAVPPAARHAQLCADEAAAPAHPARVHLPHLRRVPVPPRVVPRRPSNGVRARDWCGTYEGGRGHLRRRQQQRLELAALVLLLVAVVEAHLEQHGPRRMVAADDLGWFSAMRVRSVEQPIECSV